MSYNRYAKRTDTVQADIVTDMRKAGIEVWIIGRPVDLLTLCRGHYLPVELKSTKPTHAPDPRQKSSSTSLRPRVVPSFAPPRKLSRRSLRMHEARNERIQAQRQEGMTLMEIATYWQIAVETVCRVLKERRSTARLERERPCAGL